MQSGHTPVSVTFSASFHNGACYVLSVPLREEVESLFWLLPQRRLWGDVRTRIVIWRKNISLVHSAAAGNKRKPRDLFFLLFWVCKEGLESCDSWYLRRERRCYLFMSAAFTSVKMITLRERSNERGAYLCFNRWERYKDWRTFHNLRICGQGQGVGQGQ